jgi:dTDP-4-dehydrorhamnose 3,5-epimerase
MKCISQPISGVQLLLPPTFEDERGRFVKTFHVGQLAGLGINFQIKEEFFSTSVKNVIRGMHFQKPPHSHQKLVYCISGKVLDVVLDLRTASPTYGQTASFELSPANRYLAYIPVGFAHGFISLEDHSCLVYKTDAVHSPESDLGVRWNSFDFDWPLAAESRPLISKRDLCHPALVDLASPFQEIPI